MNKGPLACDTFVPRAQRIPFNKMLEARIRRYSQDDTSAQEAMSTPIHSPKSMAALTLPIPLYPLAPWHPSDEPFEVAPRKSEDMCLKRAAAHVLEQPHARLAESEVGRQVVSKITMSSTRHSPNDIATFPLLVPESNSGLPSALVSPASPNDRERQAVQVIDQENEASMKHPPKVKYEGAPSVKIPQGLLVEAVKAKRLNECPTCDERLASPIPVSPEPPDVPDAKRLNQEVVSAAEKSVLLHSLASLAALIPLAPTSAPVGSSPVYPLPHLSLVPEFWLRWKPPDHEEGLTRHACHAVNYRPQLSVIKCLPPPGAASMLSISRSLPAHIAQAVPRRLSRPPRRRVHIPSVGAETVQRQSAIVISARINTSAMHSPVYRVALTLPILQLACSARVNTARSQDDELVWRLHKPPDPAAKHWLPDEAINELKGGRNRSRLPVPRPELAPSHARIPCGPHPPVLLQSFTRCYSRAALASPVGHLLMAPIVLRANWKG